MSGPRMQDPKRSVTLHDIFGRMEFDHVSFSYDGSRTVLHDVAFSAEPGTVTALVGSSGSGKSTIIGLISAFHVPTAGQGPGGWDRSEHGQARFLSHAPGSSAAGVIFIRRHDSGECGVFAARARARKRSCAPAASPGWTSLLKVFAEKYDTIVGERGVKLSGGQRQRISIARAILAEPRILILDEATSSLDSESEEMIQHGLSYLMQGRTTFVIAHRLSTIRRADQILVVEQGRIVERGTHEPALRLAGPLL